MNQRLVEINTDVYHWFSKIISINENEIEIEPIICKFKNIPTKYKKVLTEECRTLDGLSAKKTKNIIHKKYVNGEFYINIFEGV